jgi:hypothetical protein
LLRRAIPPILAITASSLLAAQPVEEPPIGTVLESWTANRDYRGVVTRAAVEEGGRTIYVATRATLYVARAEKLEPIDDRAGREGRLVLAPGGGVYAWLSPAADPRDLFGVDLHLLPAGAAVPLRPAERQAPGFLGVILGFRGNLIVTVAPLRNWEGTEPPFLFTFWSREGRAVGEVRVDDHVIPVLDPAGTSLMLLGRKSANAYTSEGRLLWTRDGHYRHGAIAGGGSLALLNPAKRIREVIAVRGGDPGAPVAAPTPVHLLVLPPQGRGALVVGDRGRYFNLDVATGRLQERRLPLRERSYIFDVDYLDESRVVFGVLHPADNSLRKGWPRGTIVAVDPRGRAIFRRTFHLGDGTSAEPSIDTTWRAGVFVGFTRGATIVGRPVN